MSQNPHQLRMAQLAELRARVADAPEAELTELRLVLRELDRVRGLFNDSRARNTALIEELSRVHHVDIDPFAGVFCRTCRAEVEETRDGCAQHSPTRIVRGLLAKYAEIQSAFTILPDATAAEQATSQQVLLVAERNRLAHDALAGACKVLGPAMSPPEPTAPTTEGHRPGCAPFDCRCGCPRGQNCQDCYRCVCWRSSCCAEESLNGSGAAETSSAECATCGDTGCRGKQVEAHIYCRLCNWPHYQHRFMECATFTAD
ncbi:hypothetical protein [Streptomyces sp. NPDC015125]|uniref:hypothetical protein n=1 Tax=Streptomyces sp. NPDC015125 TaxID=3364938 RepID=UPI003701E3EF